MRRYSGDLTWGGQVRASPAMAEKQNPSAHIYRKQNIQRKN